MKNCDSCGMPLNENVTSKKEEHFCIYCQDQQTGQLKNKDEVRDGSILAMMQYEGKSKEEAEKFVDENMPKLPRWQ